MGTDGEVDEDMKEMPETSFTGEMPGNDLTTFQRDLLNREEGVNTLHEGEGTRISFGDRHLKRKDNGGSTERQGNYKFRKEGGGKRIGRN